MNTVARDLFPSAREEGRDVRRDAVMNRDKIIRAAEEVFAERGPAATLDDVAHAANVGPATLYRRFANKDALVREVLVSFFQRLIDTAHDAEQARPESGLDEFLSTVGVELARNPGLSAPVWGELAPTELVEELRDLSTDLLERAQAVDAIRRDVTVDDITAAVWALRGVINAERADAAQQGHELWRRHLRTTLRGFRD
jgi:AcrR family transcriptional regulator